MVREYEAQERASSLRSSIPSSTFGSRVAWGKFMDLSEPQFSDQHFKYRFLVGKQTLGAGCLTAQLSEVLNFAVPQFPYL